MQVFIVAEASTFGNVVKPECHAEAFPNRKDAFSALRDLVDERIYESLEGEDNRDEKTDVEVEKVFSRGDVGEFSYAGEDCSFMWRILETDV